MSRSPLRFAFAIHLHQPVGNFDHVFEDHLTGVYRPLLDAIHRHGAYPISLHLSGPLLDWLEDHAPDFLDDLGVRAADGHIEFLASGRYEPILAALSTADRVEQVEWMRADLRRRFGVDATGLWLTERVWEPDLAADLARAGIEYTLLDDRHLLACGLEPEEMDGAFTTESGGERLRLLPIDERLRYLIPFRPVGEIADFLARRRGAGQRQIVLGDDGEKFGGWPDTREWVYGGGWLEAFLETLNAARGRGELELVATREAASGPGRGLVYPAMGAYREMEEWTLPRPAARRLARLKATTSGAAHGDAEPGPLIRGGHWKGFLRRYPESNRMHKTALTLSRLCRERGDPPEARRAIARAQCNDAYWHGVFGGVYLPHLRRAIWRELATAERRLREEEGIAFEILDFDLDGHDEIWIHSARSSSVITPQRGGAIEILTVFRDGVNYVDVLSRRLEAYHRDPAASGATREADGGMTRGARTRNDGVPSVHDRESEAPAAPAPDGAPLALLQEVAFAPSGGADARERTLVADWRPHPFRLTGLPDVEPDSGSGRIRLRLRSEPGLPRLAKTLEIRGDGGIEATLDWSAADLPEGSGVVTRLPLAHPMRVEPVVTASESCAPQESRTRIVTLARSERGFEEIDQGELVELAWPAAVGRACVRLTPEGGSGTPGGPE
ncbi:MAG: DUF1925 domain-containing protein [Gemmatimonadales bacterium]|nr:DUF1925 domain-containing protein [Candidatus Palauibacter irciniicola]MYC19504.1 DUF1925 domain-containing protein [Gemmatimonadales bacterium]